MKKIKNKKAGNLEPAVCIGDALLAVYELYLYNKLFCPLFLLTLGCFIS